MLYEFEGDGGTGLRRLNLADEDDRALADVKQVFAQLEKAKTKRRVRQAVQARARAGRHLGVAPYAYRFEDKLLVTVVKEAVIVFRIFSDYVRGSSQRAIARALNDDRVPAPSGPAWRQSTVARILANVVYVGKVAHRGQVLDGVHDAIVDEELWDRAQARRTGGHGRKGGRRPDAPHLLVGGVLRCGRCGEAMICRQGRPGIGRPRYECWGRIEHGKEFCDQPSIRRELVDEPFLAHLLNGYVDLQATARRIEKRTASAVTLARQAVADAEADVARIENAIATTERDYDAGSIDGRQYAKREARLTGELDGAGNALERASEHAEEVETAGLVGDAEQLLLEHLAAVRRAVADGAGDAPDLDALRNLIGQMFDRVVLMTLAGHVDGLGYMVSAKAPNGLIPFEADVGEVLGVDGDDGYYLLPVLAWSDVDRATFARSRQELPITDLQTSPLPFRGTVGAPQPRHTPR